MGRFRALSIENRHVVGNPNPNAVNSEQRVMDFESSPSSYGQNNFDVSDDKKFVDTVPCEEDTILNNNGFDTQVMDDGDDAKTQQIDFDDETQILELAGETQVMDDDNDFLDHMETQHLHISDNQDCGCKSDKESAEGTEILGDTMDSKFQVIDGNKATSSGKKGTPHFRQGDRGAQSESLPSHHVARSSGRGFASVRTASLRAAGLAARQSTIKNADNGSSSTIFSNVASEHDDDGGGIYNIEADGVVNDVEKIDKQGLSDEDESNVVKSLARKLFLEEDVAEMGSDHNVTERREDFFHLPSCDDDVAGLSYIDSQEPGELSQANALDFVDRFLKVSIFESDQGVMHKNTKAEFVSPSAITKGAQSIAQQASCKSIPAGGSIYEWDDNLEDEGGGEFFTKKKDKLLGTMNKTHKSCHKPQSSRHHELRGSQSAGKLRKGKGKQNLHDTMNGFLHSDLKLKNGGEKGQVKAFGIEKNVDNCAARQLGLDSCCQEALPAVHDAQSVDIQNVGVDTQMAAEAMEALSAGNFPVNNDCSMADEVWQIEKDCCRIEAMTDGPSRQSSLQKRVQIPTSRIVTRSRSKRNVETRGLSFMSKFDVGLVNSRAKRSRLGINDFSPVDCRKPSDTAPVNVDREQTKSIWEGHVNNNPHPPLKRRSLRGTASIATPVVQEAAECIEHHSHVADSTFGNSGKPYCLEVVGEKKCRTRNDAVPENSNHKNETLDRTNAADVDEVDGSNSKREDIEHASGQNNLSRDKGLILSTYGGPVFKIDSIARRTRSRKNTVHSAECSRDDKGLRSSGMLSPEDACQLSSKKQDARPPSVQETLHSATNGGLPGNAKKSANPADITPVNLKTPRGAVSPICMGDGYYSPSCKKSLSLKKEFMSLIASEDRSNSPFKGLRQRRDMKNICVLFSQHLDDDIIRQQKKILSRLNVSVASSISEATHFIADIFVRTRNMLEAIANAKPVVTHLWLESCGQANCFIDEKSYILRDASKEKELGFSMPKSLAHASQRPLLEGIKVLVTPNVKPGKEVILRLVKAVQGQAVERLGRSTANDELFVLSCEEDFGVCVPLLEKGIAVYSSELLLNGIITQRLEYERYRLFVAHVKKTRSRLWLNNSGGMFLPVTKSK